jgi:Tfp pilus assembly protein PilW
MMATLITAFVFAGVLSAYIFLGRALARQLNEESLESRTRLALYWFTQDVSSASSITAAQTPALTPTSATWPFTVFTLTFPGTTGTVAYQIDWSAGSGSGILERYTPATGTTIVLLNKLSNISFGYFDITGNSVTVPASAPSNPQVNIKQANMAYTSTAGTASTGAQSSLTMVSPMIVMRNKVMLVDPNSP